jgi:hypothetical protein
MLPQPLRDNGEKVRVSQWTVVIASHEFPMDIGIHYQDLRGRAMQMLFVFVGWQKRTDWFGKSLKGIRIDRPKSTLIAAQWLFDFQRRAGIFMTSNGIIRCMTGKYGAIAPRLKERLHFFY